jgi:acylaminoacyl-peptidase
MVDNQELDVAAYSRVLGLPPLEGTAGLAALYRAITLRAPAIRSGRIAPFSSAGRLTSCAVQYELPHVETNSKLRLEQNFAVTIAEGAACPVGMPAAVDLKVLQWVSPSGRRVVRLIPGAAGETTTIHLCCADDPLTIEASITVAKSLHSAVLDSPHYQNIDWSDDETCVVYCAEAEAMTAPKLWEPSKGGDQETPKSAFEAVQSFGEAFVNFTALSLFVVDFASKNVRRVLPPDFTNLFSAVSPCWLQSDGSAKHVAFVAVPHSPTKLGLAHCCNRPAKLFVASLVEEKAGSAPLEIALPASMQTLRNMRRHGCRLAALSPALSPAHASGVALVTCAATIDGLSSWTVDIPVVDAPPSATSAFPGLFPATGNDLFWVDDENIVASTICGSSVQLLIAKVSPAVACAAIRPVIYDDDSLRLLGGADALGCSTMNVLHSDGRRFLLSFSCATAAPVVFYVDDILTPLVRLTALGSPVGRQLPPVPSKLSTAVLRVESSGRRVESLFHHHGERTSDRPLVLFVHGGPHNTDTGMYTHGIFFYLANGHNVLSVNYGGSLGFGQGQVDGLLGHVGTNDVEDVLAALADAQNRFSLRGPVIISGGSHGGFLTAHLSSRFPRLFVAAVMRNPVIDIGAMYFASDIPDWCLAESGAKSGTCAADVAMMHAASPSRHCSPIMTVPTIIGIGLNDLRVPVSQGRAWFALVKACSPATPIRLLEYPGTGHSMDSPQAALDFAVHSMAFMKEHTQRKGTGGA